MNSPTAGLEPQRSAILRDEGALRPQLRNPSGIAYLATPYTKYPAGIEAAFVHASRLAARLLVTGINVYSPIAHTHPLAIHGGLDPLDLNIWLPYDTAMMDAASVLIVGRLDGWQESKGIAYEIGVFRRAGKPIYDLEPETLFACRREEGA